MENENKMPLYELVLGENENIDGVSAISFVDHPAIEENFFFFNKQEQKDSYKFESIDDKYMVTGPAMIPNQKIFRLDNAGNEFEVFFSEDTIVKCVELFFKRSQHNQSNVQHSPFMFEGVTVIESWVIEDPENDKSNALGFNAFPKGTWMVTYKVDNEALWEKIKLGEVKGFSIEGYFIQDLVEMKAQMEAAETKEKEEQLLIDEKSYKEIESILADKSLSDEDIYDKVKDLLN